MLRHTNTYSKADLTDKQLLQEQKQGQQYFLDIRSHKLFAVEIYLVTKRFCRAQIKSSTDFKPKKLQTTITNESLDIAPNILHKTLLKVNWRDCLTEEFVGQASVPCNNIGKHLDFSRANSTSSDALRPTFPNIALKAL